MMFVFISEDLDIDQCVAHLMALRRTHVRLDSLLETRSPTIIFSNHKPPTISLPRLARRLERPIPKPS
jgi:hypothetical protein